MKTDSAKIEKEGPNNSISVLVVDNDPGDRVLLSAYLEKPRGAYEVSYADSLKAAVTKLTESHAHIVLLDLGLPDSQGIDTFLQFRRSVPDIPVIVVTGLDDKDIALEAVKFGAQDYLIKGHTGSDVLARSLLFAVERHRIVRQSEIERAKIAQKWEMQVYHHLRAAAQTHPGTESDSWRQTSPQVFQRLSAEYGRLLKVSLRNNVKPTELYISKQLGEIAQELVSKSARPHEVIEVHLSGLYAATTGESDDTMKKITEAARFLLLELMGHMTLSARS